MTRYAISLALSLAVSACAADGSASLDGGALQTQSAAGLASSPAAEHEALETTSDGVTDVEAALYASGVTDEASTYVNAAKPSCTQVGSIACSPRASGSVSHGSPQPLDPTPEATRGFEAKR